MHYFWNPAPEVWKDYAMGIRPVSFPKKLVVTGLDIVCVLPMLRRLALESDLVHLHFPLPLGISALLMRPLVRRPLDRHRARQCRRVRAAAAARARDARRADGARIPS